MFTTVQNNILLVVKIRGLGLLKYFVVLIYYKADVTMFTACFNVK
jgi:hypothetical protein